MRALRNQSLNRLIDRDSAADITDLRIVDSNFTGCVLSYSTDPRLRTTVSNVTLEGCSADDCRIYGAQFTDVSVENLHTSENGLSVTGAVFKHVTLKGRMGVIQIDSRIRQPGMNESVETGFRSANESFYRTVDWALDIRECTAESLSILGIPADLIRIDPQRQIRIYRERIESDRQWYDACEGTWWRAGVADLLTSSFADTVLVSPGTTLPDSYAQAIDQLNSLGFSRPPG